MKSYIQALALLGMGPATALLSSPPHDEVLVVPVDSLGETGGGTQTIAIGSPIPAGWIVIAQQGNYYTIKDVSSATYGLTETVIGNAATLPPNWIIQRYQVGNPSNLTYHIIKCLTAAPYNQIETMISWSPKPSGWVTTSQQANGSDVYYNIQNKNNNTKITATISNPSQNITVTSGQSISFSGTAVTTGNAAMSYRWDFGDGQTASGTSASHTYTNTGTAPSTHTVSFTATDTNGITDRATRTVIVTPATTYTITSSTGDGGSISPLGSNRFIAGTSVDFEITPNIGKIIQKLLVDGNEINQAYGSTGLYRHTFYNLNSAHTISASFSLPSTIEYKVDLWTGSGGTITVTGGNQKPNMGSSYYVPSGRTCSINIAANNGNQITFLRVDNENIDAATRCNAYNHYIPNIQSNHLISAAFNSATMLSPNTPITGPAPVLQYGGNARIRPASSVYSTDPILSTAVEYVVFDQNHKVRRSAILESVGLPYDATEIIWGRDGSKFERPIGWTACTGLSGESGFIRIKYSNGTIGESAYIIP